MEKLIGLIDVYPGLLKSKSGVVRTLEEFQCLPEQWLSNWISKNVNDPDDVILLMSVYKNKGGGNGKSKKLAKSSSFKKKRAKQQQPPSAAASAAVSRPRVSSDARGRKIKMTASSVRMKRSESAASDGAPRVRTNIRPDSSKSSSSGVKKFGNKDSRRLTMQRNEFALEELRVMTEEAAEWVATTLGVEYGQGNDLIVNFWESLRSGVDLCKLVQMCTPPDSSLKCKVKANAQPDTFFARDNISNFLSTARELGVHAVSLFETNDVVFRRNEKQVINTLLQLARIAATNGSGVQPPLIVQYEMEIDQLLANNNHEFAEDDVRVITDKKADDPYANCRWLPYIPRKNDPLDEALALAVNLHRIDVRIRRSKKRGEYRIGKPPTVCMRLVRHLLLVRVGGGWEGIVPFATRKSCDDDTDDMRSNSKQQQNMVQANKDMYKRLVDGDERAVLKKTVKELRRENSDRGITSAYKSANKKKNKK